MLSIVSSLSYFNQGDTHKRCEGLASCYFDSVKLIRQSIFEKSPDFSVSS